MTFQRVRFLLPNSNVSGRTKNAGNAVYNKPARKSVRTGTGRVKKPAAVQLISSNKRSYKKMTAQKLSSHEAGLTSRLADPLLSKQVVSASKSTGTTSRSRSTKPRLGHFLEQKLIRSGRKHSCACGRVKDGGCRFNTTTLFCHNSPLSDQFRWHGQTWFLHRTNCGHTGACNLYKPWPPADQRRSQRS